MSLTTGNLDACAAQMASWQPFAGGPVEMVEGNVGRAGPAREESFHPDVVGHPSIPRCNSGTSAIGQGAFDPSRLGVQLGGRSVSCPSLNLKSGEFACADNLALFPCRDVAVSASSGQHFGSAVCVPSRGITWGDTSSASLAKCYSLPAVQESRWDVFSANCMCTISSSRLSMMHEGRKRVRRWSKRKKQMSHAFLRSLWRWKEGVHARKRRKRAVVGSCSGSGARSYTSDPPTVGAASSGNPKSVIGTDSSGELFFSVVGNQISWGADIIASAASSESGFCTGNTEVRDMGSDHPLPCWFSNHSDGALSTESGYNSEPGYSADSELNCTDDGLVDDDDEEEKHPMHLVVWKDTAPRKPFHRVDKGQVREGGGSISDALDVVRLCDLLTSVSLRAPKAKQCVVELFYGKNHRIRRLQPRLRQTRRPWRQPDLFKSTR
ncbi:hypothetical protein MPTK1_1g24070 [Marchantia polymorpha subsp. ruderalis]|uniref:Uncharacterized protein n=2 Tax=Marchantia polymorpha TaxID=3197 RepID=A0AAF6ATP7_MARPO|nr:hypothetical protein MARPO_0061s0114 [Marchantia polymorpha]PTQ36868.1 hypothetical protein MARPO_0061s0114 [Marchantia polymorpha]BBM99816.1 hypothetical protein Mp_1g24070 [Marchantia polymorpha subsp. ruderalis]BBM99817.1 hypothetical protein Mp_1g24070 [Marchantia polymorpha subsp. ruderalis]|eukprot:PTQ36867.1 hypothetical protein MARPO_0061s0114 [Marchantia polymorpha]